MIQLTKKHTASVPAILSGKGAAEREALCQAFEEGQTEFEFHSSIYAHAQVKSSLIAAQDGKCCFCEAKIEHISYGDVEHYRPKGGWVQDQEGLNQPGYYWLAYDWDNLFLSCQICNQRHKKNFFPLFDNAKRALSHGADIGEESPVFIKPDQEDPEKFIEFKEEIPFAVNGDQRGQQTIDKLGLDREKLNERRREKLSLIRAVYEIAKFFPDIPLDLKKRAVDKIKEIAMVYTIDKAEYAAMFRAFFKNNPIDF